MGTHERIVKFESMSHWGTRVDIQTIKPWVSVAMEHSVASLVGTPGHDKEVVGNFASYA